MGRKYAAILGLVAFTTATFRGLLLGATPESTFPGACIGLFAFAAVGYVAGAFAESVVEQAVRMRFAIDLQAAESREKK